MAHARRHAPLGWAQPALPPLPDGEAQRDWPFILAGSRSPYPPHTAPGFQAAWSLGLLPPPPPTVAPQPLPGLPAHHTLLSAIGGFFGAIAIVCMLPDSTPGLVFGFFALAGMASMLVGILHLERRDASEAAAGYTSRPVFTGLWRLAPDGRVLREPDRTVPPPGFYPSPFYPGLLQKWEGPDWAPLPQHWENHAQRYFRWPDRPFLDEYRPPAE